MIAVMHLFVSDQISDSTPHTQSVGLICLDTYRRDNRPVGELPPHHVPERISTTKSNLIIQKQLYAEIKVQNFLPALVVVLLTKAGINGRR